MASQAPCLLQPTYTALACCCGSCAQGVTLRLTASACSGQSAIAVVVADHFQCAIAETTHVVFKCHT